MFICQLFALLASRTGSILFCFFFYDFFLNHLLQICSRNLDRVRKLKSAMTRLTARVQKVYLSVCMLTIFSGALPRHSHNLCFQSIRIRFMLAIFHKGALMILWCLVSSLCFLNLCYQSLLKVYMLAIIAEGHIVNIISTCTDVQQHPLLQKWEQKGFQKVTGLHPHKGLDINLNCTTKSYILDESSSYIFNCFCQDKASAKFKISLAEE